MRRNVRGLGGCVGWGCLSRRWLGVGWRWWRLRVGRRLHRVGHGCFFRSERKPGVGAAREYATLDRSNPSVLSFSPSFRWVAPTGGSTPTVVPPKPRPAKGACLATPKTQACCPIWQQSQMDLRRSRRCGGALAERYQPPHRPAPARSVAAPSRPSSCRCSTLLHGVRGPRRRLKKREPKNLAGLPICMGSQV